MMARSPARLLAQVHWQPAYRSGTRTSLQGQTSGDLLLTDASPGLAGVTTPLSISMAVAP